MRNRQKGLLFGIFLITCAFTVSCSSRLGYGVLLWSMDEPPIQSGTVLPVYIRSNITRTWVVGVPEGLREGIGGADKVEIPLSRLEMAGNKRRANRLAESFAPYARVYAENLQDGLPIRSSPDNTSRRVYRLRRGEIVKILSTVEGIPPISTTGEPLPGGWFQVLTEDGTIGFCFSYRLRLFEHTDGQLAASVASIAEVVDDPDLDMLLSRSWSHEAYLTMVNTRRINLDALSHRWRFDPGYETGVARIIAPGIDRSFQYTSIIPDGRRAWRFEGSTLTMQLRSDTTLAVQFLEGSGVTRTLLFVALAVNVDDLIIQETVRRETLFETIFAQGPAFTSSNFGTITFTEGGAFTWRGFDLLVPQYISETAEGRGTVSMDLFLAGALQSHYDGAFTLRFAGGTTVLRCIYSLDNQGFRLEIVPETSMDGVNVARRAASPMVMFFFRDTGVW
jgi:hypothetical protein